MKALSLPCALCGKSFLTPKIALKVFWGPLTEILQYYPKYEMQMEEQESPTIPKNCILEFLLCVDQTLSGDSDVASALDRLGDKLVQQCEEGGLASRVASLEERINQLTMQLASFNMSR